MKPIFLKGDYTGKNKERQRQAKVSGCDFVVSFHFNSANTPSASGAEIYHNDKELAQKIAQELIKRITKVLGNKVRGVKSAKGTRASFINFYHCPAVLLEPCFVSNPNEATKLHDVNVVRELAREIVEVLKLFLPADAVIGLDIGHKFKTSSPNDMGAACVAEKGCSEAKHGEQLAKAVASLLT